ncbi:unnamed protein product [Parnassius apollo]|uniref:(apollo) hypothetical protein n=1 Tax=Parnassius apollo TaxID=110799 RepID=A0A8S3W2B6_PARAO|nr:unnamed protein product [Parnassius apollo]
MMGSMSERLSARSPEKMKITEVFLLKVLVGRGRPRKVAHDQLRRVLQPGEQAAVSPRNEPISDGGSYDSLSLNDLQPQNLQNDDGNLVDNGAGPSVMIDATN